MQMLGTRPDELKKDQPALLLAPMEGVTDAPMRAFLTERGGFTHCVTEFIRISQDVPHLKTFKGMVPELATGSRTEAGTLVQVQLLGGDAEKLARAAARLVEAGSPGIDLNFGCPAPTVNRHDGGATLLKYPERIRTIVSAVRQAVPAHLPVSAKLRLGWESIEDIHVNADMAAQGGASWITIHARTKVQGYRPPAFWKQIGMVRKRLQLPIVANGDIWTFDDFLRCREDSQCHQFMIGRSALADLGLQVKIAKELGIPVEQSLQFDRTSPKDWSFAFGRFISHTLTEPRREGYSLARIKQWISLASTDPRLRLDWLAALRQCPTLSQLLEQLNSL